MKDAPKRTKFSPYLNDFIAGSVAGCAATVTGHPIDTVKVRLQSSLNYKSAFDCVRSILLNEGSQAFYRGLLVPLATSMVVSASAFATYGYVLNFIKRQEEPSCSEIFVSGLLSGIPTAFILSPVELIKVQLQGGPRNFKGPTDCIKYLTRNGSIFCGMSATMMRETPAYGIYFLSYHYLTDILQKAVNMGAVTASFVGGALAGALSWVVIYPLDVVKTNIQLLAVTPTPGAVQGRVVYDVNPIRMLFILQKERGTKFLFRGLGVCMLRALPVNAVVFPSYHMTLNMLEKL